VTIAAGSLGAAAGAVRAWEAVSFAAFLAGLLVLRRKGEPVLWGIFAGCGLVLLFDWIWNRNWFGAVSYSDRFIPAWGARGEIEPLCLVFVYCAFFGLPLIVALDHRDWLDRRLGRWQWAALFAAFALPQMPFEILATQGLHLWTYHVRSPWAIDGVPWSNAAFSGLLGCGFYAAGRLALRWAAPAARRTRESWLQAFATAVALATLALALVTYLFLPWYLIVQPWAHRVPPL